MRFQAIYLDGEMFLPKIELYMTSNQLIGIIKDLKRKQVLINIVDAITIMILFGTFIIELLTYIAINYKRK